MDRPEKLITNGEEYFSLGSSVVLVGIGFMVFVGGIVLTQTEATLKDLVLPMGALSVLWLLWMALNFIIGSVHKISTRRDINRLFDGEIWQRWQYRSDEWQGIVESEYQAMCPEGGAGAYIGAVYSGIVGLVISAILVGVGKYVIKDEQVTPIINITAVAVLVLLVGIGLFQPVYDRYKAGKHRRKALRVLSPRVWFGAEGVYHEAIGYTSLKGLTDIKDHTRKQRTIQFTVEVPVVFSTGGFSSPSTHDQPVSFSVPSGYEQQAASLVRRYRQERVGD